jgi:uncharacterized membrane protein
MQHEAGQAEEVNLGVFVSAFLAASIEVIEMVAIIVAVGIARSWRSSLAGAAGGLIVLIVLVAVLGAALHNVPLAVLRFAVGSLLLVFGLQWLRKGVVRVARDGWAVGVGDEEVEAGTSGGAMDWAAFVLSFKGVSLEGLEVAVIIVAFGSAATAIGSAVIGAAGAVVLIGAMGLAAYRAVAHIPRRALQLFVGVMLVTFGTFWSGQGLGVSWPGHDLALLWLGVGYMGSALVLLRLVVSWRRDALTAAQHQSVNGVQP